MNFEILKKLQDINNTESFFGEIYFTPRSPILLENGPFQTLPLWKLFGLYILVEKNEDWNVNLENYSGELLYVGKTNSNVHERIKSHFGLSNMQSTYENHRWHSVSSISSDIKSKLGSGSVVLYSIEVGCKNGKSAEKFLGILPEMAEKHLLLSFALKFGRLPYLNLQF